MLVAQILVDILFLILIVILFLGHGSLSAGLRAATTLGKDAKTIATNANATAQDAKTIAKAAAKT